MKQNIATVTFFLWGLAMTIYVIIIKFQNTDCAFDPSTYLSKTEKEKLQTSLKLYDAMSYFVIKLKGRLSIRGQNDESLIDHIQRSQVKIANVENWYDIVLQLVEGQRPFTEDETKQFFARFELDSKNYPGLINYNYDASLRNWDKMKQLYE